jgi:hypothetical protein
MFSLGTYDLIIVLVLVGIVWAVVAATRRPGSAMAEMICPNASCGYRGAPDKTPRGNILVGCALCLLFLLPGILYFVLLGGYRYRCPNCGIQIAADN